MLTTPHSGYHWDGNSDPTARFFEGWYYRVTLPQQGESIAFMYSIEDPQGGQPHSGGAVQILGPQDEYICRTFPGVKSFWAKPTHLALGHWGKTSLKQSPDLLPPEVFTEQIEEGYQATATLNQGRIKDPSTGNFCSWHYQIEPIFGWGNAKGYQKATGGLVSYLPIFEPGWQILTAHAHATGWINWNGQRYEFKQARAYAEKNWGRSFPERWFWLNCNYFDDIPNLALTAAGGKRGVLWWSESVALIGLHHQGDFYEFAPWNAKLNWKVQPWGNWQLEASNSKYYIEILGNTTHPGTWVKTPTSGGLISCCRDTTRGDLAIKLSTAKGHTILKAHSHLPGLEIGGQSWQEPWVSC